jgi:hypothetical protein
MPVFNKTLVKSGLQFYASEQHCDFSVPSNEDYQQNEGQLRLVYE